LYIPAAFFISEMPFANLGRVLETRALTMSGFAFTEAAGIIASPLEILATIESEVPVPGPFTIPPDANFLAIVVGAGATISLWLA
jgi:hypothetical protein